ncbi:MAG: VWA domain-containing protein [Terracidiphilus sp.]|nr:VWA domain-containing protein [Terracidiphilus sp.]
MFLSRFSSFSAVKFSAALLILLAPAWLLAQQAPASPAAAPASPSVVPASPVAAPARQDTAAPAQDQNQNQTPAARPPYPSSAAPAPTPGYTLHVVSRLVVLDMVVVDKKGNVVKDLGQDDFKVEEEGEQQSILHFEKAGAFTSPAALSIESTADLDRLAPRAPVNIILLDEFNTRFEDMAFARYSLKKFLEKQPDKLATPTMLIAVDLQHFTVLRDYTQNKEELIKSLDHHFVAYPWQTHQYAWIGERYATAFVTLRRVAQAVTGHPGHKNMIWIGRGFPAFNFSRMPIDTSNRVESAVQECVNVLRDARVTLYTIDPAGVQVNPGIYGGGPFAEDPFGGNYEFNRLAKATGGRTLYGRNDVDMEIGTAIQDGSSFYTLAYRPTNSSPDPRKFRHIKVTLSRPGLSVITRAGYYLERGPGRVDATNPSRRLLSDLYSADSSTMVYDAVHIDVQAVPNDPNQFTIHVDGHNLVWSPATDTESRHSEVILVVSTYDKKDKELSQVAKIIRSNAPASAPPSGRMLRDMILQQKIDANPKAVRARFTVRVSATGRIGTADVQLGPHSPTPAPQPAK